MSYFKNQKIEKKAFFSVIIPVRNEAKNIINLLKDLENQSYPKSSFEVIVADDSSIDDTLKILQEFQKNTSISLIINQLGELDKNASPKKRAINSSINLSQGELITTTDGDCRVGEFWLETLNEFYQKTDANLISAGVVFIEKQRASTVNFMGWFFNKIQIIEFASLIGTGACSMSIQQPNMCNGANLTYKKKVFYEVNGFAGNENLASGDDEFLMHKIAACNLEKVLFLKAKEAIVETEGHLTFKSFYNQRKRWASKWKHYKNLSTLALAVFIFLANFLLIITAVLWLNNSLTNLEIIQVIVLKFTAEFVFLSLIISYLAKVRLIVLIPIVQVVYPFYVSFFGLIAQGKGYEWKGRKLE